MNDLPEIKVSRISKLAVLSVQNMVQGKCWLAGAQGCWRLPAGMFDWWEKLVFAVPLVMDRGLTKSYRLCVDYFRADAVKKSKIQFISIFIIIIIFQSRMFRQVGPRFS